VRGFPASTRPAVLPPAGQGCGVAVRQSVGVGLAVPVGSAVGLPVGSGVSVDVGVGVGVGVGLGTQSHAPKAIDGGVTF